MNKIYITAIVAAGIFLTVAFTNKFHKKHTMADSKNGFAVVELFTSEGCSSCPSADRAVAALLSKNTSNVYILAYHVDYWNRLGWKDVFSKAEFSARQRKYASHFAASGVYTPQVIVNGAMEFVGSNESKLNNSVSQSLENNKGSDLTITATKNAGTVTVDYEINEAEPVLLNIALVEPEASTNVKRGENGGSTLHHVNIVRELNAIEVKGKGTTTIKIPKELSAMPLELIAFTQQKNTFKILGADKKQSL